MQEVEFIKQVAQFHEMFQHPILQEPAIPSEKRCKLRVDLIAEELKELEGAIEQQDIVQIADALCDIQYVLSGAVLEFGLGNKFKELFNEVQRSNMSKSCSTLEEAEATLKHYEEIHQTECYHKEVNGKYLVYRKADNKTLKSVNYSPADIPAILNK